MLVRGMRAETRPYKLLRKSHENLYVFKEVSVQSINEMAKEVIQIIKATHVEGGGGRHRLTYFFLKGPQ